MTPMPVRVQPSSVPTKEALGCKRTEASISGENIIMARDCVRLAGAAQAWGEDEKGLRKAGERRQVQAASGACGDHKGARASESTQRSTTLLSGWFPQGREGQDASRTPEAKGEQRLRRARRGLADPCNSGGRAEQE